MLVASAILTTATVVATEGHATTKTNIIPYNVLNLTTLKTQSVSLNSKSSFIHTQPESNGPLLPLTISTTFKSSNVSNVVLNYHTELDTDYKQIEMKNNNGTYSVELSPELRQGQNITYYMTAVVNGDSEYSDEYTIFENQPAYNAQKVPQLLITEIVARSTKVNNAEAYEYVEVYNNSTNTINLKNYNIQYRYPSKGAKGDLIWPVQNKGDLNLEPGQTMVFWITNDENRHLTIQDFNANYDSHLTERQNIVRIEGDKLSNSDYRGIAIATNTRIDVATAFYNQDENKLDVGLNQGIVYAYPIDGKKKMRIISSKETKGTPGVVEGYQVPTQKVTPTQSYYPPTIIDNTEAESFSTEEDAHLAFHITADVDLKTATFYYKRNGDSDYQAMNMTKGTDGYYHAIIPRADLIGHTLFKYYVEASDGEQVSKTGITPLEITGYEKISGLQLNVDNGTLITGKTNLKAIHLKSPTASTMTIDGVDVTNQMTYELPKESYFTFEANQTANYYKNAVTINDTILRTFDDRYDDFTALTVPVDASHFQKGEPSKFQIRSGSKESSFDTSGANLNDILVRNMRLVLHDGTTLYPTNYTDPQKPIDVGDASGSPRYIEPSFDIPEQAFSAKSYTLDTSKLSDGEHTIVVKNGKTKKTVKVIVDNSAPEINSSIINNQTYKGNFTIDAEVIDANAGDAPSATLDGEPIELPYDTSSAQLSAGTHTIVYQVADRLGNTTTKTVKFKTNEEMPYDPELVAPTKNGVTDTTAPLLKVKVSDPTHDNLHVSFNKGYTYTPADTEVTTVENNADQEPPKQLSPLGEVTVRDTSAIEKADGMYLTTTSKEKYPYHRFQLNVDSSVTADDDIEINWEGKSLLGRKVTMYVWNYDTSKWEAKIWKIADSTKNFKLSSLIKGDQYIRHHQVQVMVQDEIAETSQFDYSFIWMGDTQYYSKSYPDIYNRMTSWVANQKAALNIKYVFHSGDLVDTYDNAKQWKAADTAMRTLDTAGVAYGVLAGNHDVTSTTHKDADYTYYNQYFSDKRFADKSYRGGSYKNNRGSYDLVSEKGTSYIMMNMGWEIGDEEVAWMNSILKKYPERKAILNFHEYLGTDGQRTDTGNYLFEKVVKPNKNVIAVLSGHLSDAETKVDAIDDNKDGKTDRKVYQMLMDYQSGAEGGQGFLRILKVNPVNNKIKVETYSPYLDKYNYYDPQDYPEKDQFEMDVQVAPEEKMVATDAIHFNVYTNQKIGELHDVIDGDTVQMRWSGLETNHKYNWYVKLSDAFDGEKRSPVWQFTSGKTIDTSNHAKIITIKDNEQNVLVTQKAESGYEIPIPSKENAIFEGLYTDETFEKAVKRSDIFTKETTLYAKFATAPDTVNIVSTSYTYNSATLNWTPLAEANGYEVYRSTKKNSGYELIATTDKMTYKDKSLTTGTKYYYKVRGIYKSGDITLRGEASEATLVKPVTATTVLSALTKKSTTVSGSFKKVSGAEAYVVYRSSNGGMYKKIATLDAKKVKFTDKTTKKGNIYTYKVRSYRTVNDKKMYSSYSNTRTIKLK